MDGLTFKDTLATTASICTISQFLAGILVCRKFVINGNTGDTSGFAFVTCFMSCSLWLRYGQLIGDSFVVLVNVFGAVLEISYTLMFIYYSTKKSVVLRQFIAAILFVAAIYIYSVVEVDKPLAVRRVGFLSCGLTILFFASPLIMLAHVIRVRSAESLPFPVIVATLVASCQWFAYGVLLNDPFIQTPNFLGCLLSGFQLALFVIYPRKRNDQAHLI